MLPAPAILENCSFSASSDIRLLEYIFQAGIAELACFRHRIEYCLKKIARKTQGSANISKFP